MPSPRPILEAILDNFFGKNVCPTYEQFKGRVVPKLAKAGYDGSQITTLLERFKTEWWRVAEDFERRKCM